MRYNKAKAKIKQKNVAIDMSHQVKTQAYDVGLISGGHTNGGRREPAPVCYDVCSHTH